MLLRRALFWAKTAAMSSPPLLIGADKSEEGRQVADFVPARIGMRGPHYGVTRLRFRSNFWRPDLSSERHLPGSLTIFTRPLLLLELGLNRGKRQSRWCPRFRGRSSSTTMILVSFTRRVVHMINSRHQQPPHPLHPALL